MAVDYGLSLGFAAEGLMTALLVTQLVGFPAALVFGRIGERYGPKFGIGVAILGAGFALLMGSLFARAAIGLPLIAGRAMRRTQLGEF